MLLWEAAGGGKKLPRRPVSSTVQPISTRLRSIRQTNRCAAKTRAGRPCRCRRAEGSKYCNFHDPDISAQIREKSRIKREARKREMANLPEGYNRTLTNIDGISQGLDRLYREVRLGIVSPRTATVMLAIIDRLMIYDKLVSTVGKRKVAKRMRAVEVRQQLAAVLDDLKHKPQQVTAGKKPKAVATTAVVPAR